MYEAFLKLLYFTATTTITTTIIKTIHVSLIKNKVKIYSMVKKKAFPDGKALVF